VPVTDPDDAEELSNVRAAAVAVWGDAGLATAYAAGAGLTDTEAFGLTWAG
jgi:hypothetical protein